MTHSDIKYLETVAGGGTEAHHLRPGIGDGNLEVAICVLLLEHDADRRFNVYEEATGARDDGLVV